MGVILYESVQFIPADVKGVILVKKAKMLSPLLYSDGLHCSFVLSGHLNSQRIW